jgi:hypothetical protein
MLELIGGKVANARLQNGVIRTSLEPWKIRTFTLR